MFGIDRIELGGSIIDVNSIGSQDENNGDEVKKSQLVQQCW